MITISKKLRLTVRVISLALVLCICLSVVMTPKAHAISELVIVGAIALTLSAVAAVVILAAEPLGLKEPIMAAAQHGFQSPREFTADLLDRFGASQGIQRFVLLDRFQKGLLITTTGKVLIDKALSDLLKDFFDWSWSSGGGNLQAFQIITGDITINTSDVTGFPYDWGDVTYSTNEIAPPAQKNYIFTSENPYTIVYTSRFSQTITVYVGDSAFTVNQYSKNTNQLVSSLNADAVSITVSGETKTYYVKSILYQAGQTQGTINITNQNSTTLAALAYLYYEGIGEGTGDLSEPDTDALILPAPDSYNSLDVPGALTLPAPISGTTTATQYLEAAADAITAGTGSLEYEDTYGNTQTGTLQGTGEVGLTQVGTQSNELEGAIDIADSVGSETLDNYTIDLKDFFPFCIPFDLWDMLNLLESAPAPVSVEWQFDFGQLGEYEMEINLEEWNSVAQTLRTMELLAFCFGLAMLTKRILMGS